MSLTRHALALGLAALIGACGGAETLDQSIAALDDAYNGKQYAQVVTDSDALIKRCEAEKAPAADVWRIEKLRLQALGKQGHGSQALTHMARLEGAHAGKVDAKLYGMVGEMVMNATGYTNNLQEAIEILDAGKKKWPDKADYFGPQIEALTARVMSGGSDADKEKLKQLGYL